MPTPAIDPLKARECHTLGRKRAMMACRVDPTGRYVLAGGMQPEVTQYQLAGEAGAIDWTKAGPFVELTSHKTWVCAVAFQPDGRRFFSADYAGTLSCWEFPAVDAAAKPLWTKPAHQGWVRAVAVSPDGKSLATCGNDNLVRLWSTADGRPLFELKAHDCHVYSLLFHPGGGRLLSGDLRGRICEWDTATGRLLRDTKAESMWVRQSNLQLGGIRCLASDAEGKLFAAGGMYGFGSIGDGIGSLCVQLFDWKHLEHISILRAAQDQRSFINGVHFHPSGLLIGVAGGLDAGWIVFWQKGQLVSFHQHKLPQSGWASDFHPDGQHLAVAHHDNSLRLYDLSGEMPPAGGTSGD